MGFYIFHRLYIRWAYLKSQEEIGWTSDLEVAMKFVAPSHAREFVNNYVWSPNVQIVGLELP